MGNNKKKAAQMGIGKATADLLDDTVNSLSTNKINSAFKNLNEKEAELSEIYNRCKEELEMETSKVQLMKERWTLHQELWDPGSSAIEKMFSKGENGLYLYQGKAMCCLDVGLQHCTSETPQPDARCKHELCARAHSTGIRWKELDTIKLYDGRMRHEKSRRMKDALSSQRDIELGRLKQSEDEEEMKSARRLQKQKGILAVAPPTFSVRDPVTNQVSVQSPDRVIFEARISMLQAHKYNTFVDARNRIISDLDENSDVLSSKAMNPSTCEAGGANQDNHLQSEQVALEDLEREQEWYMKKITETVESSSDVAVWHRCCLAKTVSPNGGTSIGRTVCNLVKELFTELKMPIDSIRDPYDAQLAVERVERHPVHKNRHEVLRMKERISETIQKQYEIDMNVQSSINTTFIEMDIAPAPLRKRIIDVLVSPDAKVNCENGLHSELNLIEEAAALEIIEAYQELSESPVQLKSRLAEIESAATAKSRLPEVTKTMLDIMISTQLDVAKGVEILQSLDQLSDNVLVANITGLVFMRAEKKVEWLAQSHTAIQAMFDAVSIQPLPSRVTQALQRVQVSIQARSKAPQNAVVPSSKVQQSAIEPEATTTSTSPIKRQESPLPFRKIELSEIMPDWEMPFTDYEQSIIDAVESYVATIALRYTTFLSKTAECPACATLRIARLFTALVLKSPGRVHNLMLALASAHLNVEKDGTLSHPMVQPGPKSWTHIVSCGVWYIFEMYNHPSIRAKCTREDAAPMFGAMVVSLIEHSVGSWYMLSEEKSQTLIEPRSHIPIVKQFAEDDRFICASFSGGSCARGELLYRKRMDSRVNTHPSSPVASCHPDTSIPKAEDVDPAITPIVASETEKGCAPLQTSLVPGPPRRRLLPRGARHQNRSTALDACVSVALMSQNLAKKMSAFCHLQQKAYNQAGLDIPVEMPYYWEEVHLLANHPPRPRKTIPDIEQTPSPAADGPAQKTSKFSENLKPIPRHRARIVTEDREVTDDELLSYTEATMVRIDNIINGDTSLEYICSIAYKLNLKANKAEAAGQSWELPIKQFENFFTSYAAIPLKLKLALDFAKGKLWPSPDCKKNYPSKDWPLIDEILSIMGRIGAKELIFPDNDSWRTKLSQRAALLEEELLAIPRVEILSEDLQGDDGGHASPLSASPLLATQLNDYTSSAWTMIEYIVRTPDEQFHPEDDVRLMAAMLVQAQHVECVRIGQLIAQARGWARAAEKLKGYLSDWGFEEDAEGRLPEFWDVATVEEGEEERETVKELEGDEAKEVEVGVAPEGDRVAD